MELWLAESFQSIQGEGLHMGRLCSFLRLAGCNIHCAFCDTDHKPQQRVHVEDVRNWLIEKGLPMIVVTGGEPLVQYDALMALMGLPGMEIFEWHLETNGTIPLKPEHVKRFTHIAVSFKGPSAQVNPDEAFVAYEAWCDAAVNAWGGDIVFKFVIGTEKDIEWVDHFLNDLPVNIHVILQPEDLAPSHEEIVTRQFEWLLKSMVLLTRHSAYGRSIRVMPRLHRLLFGNKKGA